MISRKGISADLRATHVSCPDLGRWRGCEWEGKGVETEGGRERSFMKKLGIEKADSYRGGRLTKRWF